MTMKHTLIPSPVSLILNDDFDTGIDGWYKTGGSAPIVSWDQGDQVNQGPSLAVTTPDDVAGRGCIYSPDPTFTVGIPVQDNELLSFTFLGTGTGTFRVQFQYVELTNYDIGYGEFGANFASYAFSTVVPVGAGSLWIAIRTHPDPQAVTFYIDHVRLISLGVVI